MLVLQLFKGKEGGKPILELGINPKICSPENKVTFAI